MKVVIFGANSSPFLLCATVRHHAKSYSKSHPEASKMLDKNLYVDDLMGGGDNIEEAFTFYEQIKTILQDAQMQLSKWATSSPLLHQRWKNLKEDVAANDLPLSPKGSTKILGLHWACQEDAFFFGRKLEAVMSITKRNILRLTAQLFDPLGLLGPVTVRAKLLIQDLWLSGCSWDEELSNPHADTWLTWTSELTSADLVRIPRYLLGNLSANEASWSLHVFCDASERAYGAAAYIRVETGAESFAVSLVASRNRVAPLKKVTIPRLELLGTIVGTRLRNYVLQSLDLRTPPTEVVCWTDFQIALHWIRGDAHRWKTFVANRVQEIQESTAPEHWRYCPGLDNSADLVTRGVFLNHLSSCDGWWHGPHWLKEGCSAWPSDRINPIVSSTELERKVVTTAVTMSEPPIDVRRYSRLNRLLRVTAWVRRVKPSSTPHPPQLTATEVQEAADYWVKVTQFEAFPDELTQLFASQPLPRNSPIQTLTPFLASSIIRIRARLQQAELRFAVRHPILLPSGGPFVDLLLHDIHERLFHAGPSETLAEARERYWVIRGHQAARRVVNRCLVCRRMKVKPAIAPMAPLPSDRVNREPPFAVVGIDFAGPLFVVHRSEPVSKCYFVIFSCAVTRAIHLELVSSMSVDHFVLCLRHFFARYGISHTIYSDNAKTFKRAQKELRPLWNVVSDPAAHQFITSRRVTWKFIVERAAWLGGFWERLVKSVKDRLKRMIGCTSLSYEALETLLLEISAAVNSRLLCYLSEDANDWQVLSPGHFLTCSRPASLPMITPEHNLSSAPRGLREKWQQRNHLQDQFWRLWRKDYLLLLRHYHQVPKNDALTGAILKAGDLVLLHQDRVPCHCWPLARLVEVFHGRDGHIRSCRLQTEGGATLNRSIQHVYPLEL